MVARVCFLAGLMGLLCLVSGAADKANLCDESSLPVDVATRLKEEFPAWKVQSVADLAPMTKGRWRDEKPLSCPGIAKGQFKDAGQTSYAFLLVPTASPDHAYKFLVLTPSDHQSADSLTVVGDWDKGNVSHYFIHTVDINKVFSSAWVQKLHVDTREGILFVDAAESEYGVEVYFPAHGKYQHEPIDY